MQMMVYENYSRFISATDTIKSMQTHVTSLSSDLADLKETIQSVSGKSQDFDMEMKLKRSKIDRLEILLM